MRALKLLSTLGLFAFGACAPLQNQTHYERWDAYAAAHPETDEEAEPGDAPADMKKASPAAKPTPAAAKKPATPPPAPPADYSSLGGNGTPAISGTKTATKTRVVQPEAEDEPLY